MDQRQTEVQTWVVAEVQWLIEGWKQQQRSEEEECKDEGRRASRRQDFTQGDRR